MDLTYSPIGSEKWPHVMQVEVLPSGTCLVSSPFPIYAGEHVEFTPEQWHKLTDAGGALSLPCAVTVHVKGYDHLTQTFQNFTFQHPDPNVILYPKGAALMATPKVHTAGTTTVSSVEHDAKKALVPILVKTAFQNIKQPLSTLESVSLGKALADLHVQREHVYEQRKESIEAFRNQIETLSASIKKTAKTLASGVDEKLVECETHFDFNTDTVSLFVKGSTKPVSTRFMTDEEKQIPMEAYLENDYAVKMPKKDLELA